MLLKYAYNGDQNTAKKPGIKIIGAKFDIRSSPKLFAA